MFAIIFIVLAAVAVLYIHVYLFAPTDTLIILSILTKGILGYDR